MTTTRRNDAELVVYRFLYCRGDRRGGVGALHIIRPRREPFVELLVDDGAITGAVGTKVLGRAHAFAALIAAILDFTNRLTSETGSGSSSGNCTVPFAVLNPFCVANFRSATLSGYMLR